MFPVVIKDGAPFKRREFQIYLENRNIQTRPVFTGNILRQPICKNINYRTNRSGYINADRIMKGGVLLPVHHGMTNLMFESLHSIIDEFIEKNK
jgi:CDP-6-deoxy-D-xylo-4-hexulose-3-dehydrase